MGFVPATKVKKLVLASPPSGEETLRMYSLPLPASSVVVRPKSDSASTMVENEPFSILTGIVALRSSPPPMR